MERSKKTDAHPCDDSASMRAPMNILFVHQNFPGQFKHLAPALAQQGHKVVALHINACLALPDVQLVRYRPKGNRARARTAG